MGVRDDLIAGVRAEARRSFVLRALLAVWVPLGGVAIAVDCEMRAVVAGLIRRLATLDQAGVADHHIEMLSMFTMWVLIVTIVSWLAWQSRAQANLRLVGCAHTKFGPLQAAAAWFVPIWQLVAPSRAMRELWIRSNMKNATRAIDEDGEPIPVLVWWIVLLMSRLGDVIGRAIIGRQPTLASLHRGAITSLVTHCLVTIAAVAAIVVVTRIHRMQAALTAADAAPAILEDEAADPEPAPEQS